MGRSLKIEALQNPWPLPELAGFVELVIHICQELVGEKLDGQFGQHVDWAVSLDVWTQLAGFHVDVRSKLQLPRRLHLQRFSRLCNPWGCSFVDFLEVSIDIGLESLQSGIRHVGD